MADTRVTLDAVVTAFEQDATAEEIAQQYPSLHLAGIYAVIGFYLNQRSAVEVYLQGRQERAQLMREQDRCPPRPARYPLAPAGASEDRRELQPGS